MGIQGFYQAMTKMFPRAAMKISIRNGRAWIETDSKRIPFSPEFTHLLFDCNSELYIAAGRVSIKLLHDLSFLSASFTAGGR
jgi:hypothetical protein